MSAYLIDRFLSVHLATSMNRAAPTDDSSKPIKPRASGFKEAALIWIRKITSWCLQQMPSMPPRATASNQAKNSNPKVSCPDVKNKHNIQRDLSGSLGDFFKCVVNQNSSNEKQTKSSAKNNLGRIIAACHFGGVSTNDSEFRNSVLEKFKNLDADKRLRAVNSLRRFIQATANNEEIQDDAGVVFLKTIAEICSSKEATLVSPVRDFPEIPPDLREQLDKLGN